MELPRYTIGCLFKLPAAAPDFQNAGVFGLRETLSRVVMIFRRSLPAKNVHTKTNCGESLLPAANTLDLMNVK
jgi:hypothetical protein